MKLDTIKRRLNPQRPMTPVTLRMPQDVVDDLKRVARLKGFPGYQALIRAYVGQGLRADLETFEESALDRIIENLKQQGVEEAVLQRAMAMSAAATSEQKPSVSSAEGVTATGKDLR